VGAGALVDLVAGVPHPSDDGRVVGQPQVDAPDTRAIVAPVDREATLERAGEEARLGSTALRIGRPQHPEEPELHELVAEERGRRRGVGEDAVRHAPGGTT
jgi:hypothetical protein